MCWMPTASLHNHLEWKWSMSLFLSVLLSRSLFLSFYLFSTPQKSCLWVFQSKGCHWAPTKAKDSWRLDPDEVHYLITDSRKHLMLFSLLFGRKRGGLTEAGLRSARWENWKERWQRGTGGKGCSPFIFVCLTASVGREKKRGGKQGRGKKRTRDSLKHCLYAFESRTTPLTSKCFYHCGVWFCLSLYVCACLEWMYWEIRWLVSVCVRERKRERELWGWLTTWTH